MSTPAKIIAVGFAIFLPAIWAYVWRAPWKFKETLCQWLNCGLLALDRQNPKMWPFKWDLFCSNLKWYRIAWRSNFWTCEQDPVMWPFKWKLFSGTFTWNYYFIWYEDVTSESTNKILRTDDSNETLSVVLSHSTVSCQVYKQKIKILVHIIYNIILK